jgi:hypothetical protein
MAYIRLPLEQRTAKREAPQSRLDHNSEIATGVRTDYGEDIEHEAVALVEHRSRPYGRAHRRPSGWSLVKIASNVWLSGSAASTWTYSSSAFPRLI